MIEWGLYDEKRAAWLIGHGGVPWRMTRVEAHAMVVEIARLHAPEWEARRFTPMAPYVLVAPRENPFFALIRRVRDELY